MKLIYKCENENNKMNVMIDLETLGTGVDTMILTLAAVEFNLTTEHTSSFYFKVDIDSYKSYGNRFSLDAATLTWWMTEAPAEARLEAFSGSRMSLETIMNNFIQWFSTRKQAKVWSHGSSFDISILSHTLSVLKMEIPWSFWNIRDTRTIYDVANINFKSVIGPQKFPVHHALGDCYRQIEGVRKANEILLELKTREPQQKKRKC